MLVVDVGGGCLDIFSLIHHFSFFFSLSLGDGPIETEILSQRAVKRKTTNQLICEKQKGVNFCQALWFNPITLRMAKTLRSFGHSECNRVNSVQMDGWMTCDFTSFSRVFQSYQDDERLLMKGCVQWNPGYGWEDFALRARLELKTARSVGQGLTHWTTRAPTLLSGNVQTGGTLSSAEFLCYTIEKGSKAWIRLFG